MANFLKTVNNRGIPCIESNSVATTTDAIIFSFNMYDFIGNNFSGLIAIKISQQFTAPVTAVPIRFITKNVSNSVIDVETLNNTVVTSADWQGTGIYIAFYDRESNKLQLINGI